MADPNEPKKETVRIVLPLQEPVAKPSGTNTRSRDTVRIQLPAHQSAYKLPHQPPDAPKPPARAFVPPSLFTSPEASSVPSPGPAILSAPEPAPDPSSVSAAPESISAGPKKETARVPVMPEPRAMPAPAVEMKKTQPLIAMPQIASQSTSIAVASTGKAEESAMISAIPMPICWALLGVSTVILIIQIWTYLS
jgi:hypothetical protein